MGQPPLDGVPSAVSTGSGPPELVFEVDGPDVHPHSVDALNLLEMASAYFALVAAQAASQGSELRFEGIAIRDKCALLAATVSNVVVANMAAQQARRVLIGEARPPRGGTTHVKRFNKAAKNFQERPDRTLMVGGANWKLPIAVVKESRSRPMDSLVTLPARVVKVGGREPSVRFDSPLESEEFTLRASEDLARALGNQLYREVEISAQIERGRDGAIAGGEVLAFELVDAACEDPWGPWEQWFQAVTRVDE